MRLSPDDWLGKTVTASIDRPLGSPHPQHPDLIYELNYGEVPGTLAADGDPLDAYIMGADTPLGIFTGIVIAIIRRENDMEDKLVLAMRGATFPPEQIARRRRFRKSGLTAE